MDKKSQIVELAAKIIVEEGVARLTLSHIAAKAGLTKAGLLYHFPTMQDLKIAILRWSDERYSQAYLDAISSVDPYPGRTPEMYLKCMSELYTASDSLADKAAAALYAAQGETQFVAGAYQNSYERLKADCHADGGNVGEALSIIMAFETMCFGTGFGIRLTEEEQQAVWDSLLERIRLLKKANT